MEFSKQSPCLFSPFALIPSFFSPYTFPSSPASVLASFLTCFLSTYAPTSFFSFPVPSCIPLFLPSLYSTPPSLPPLSSFPLLPLSCFLFAPPSFVLSCPLYVLHTNTCLKTTTVLLIKKKITSLKTMQKTWLKRPQKYTLGKFVQENGKKVLKLRHKGRERA